MSVDLPARHAALVPVYVKEGAAHAELRVPMARKGYYVREFVPYPNGILSYACGRPRSSLSSASMALIAYLDETGNSSLTAIDPDFPVFVLCVTLFERAQYTDVVIPAICRLKLDVWGHEGVVLHSRDIRKAQGACWFLRDRAERAPFYERINTVVTQAPMMVCAVAVHTAAHRALHAERARDPYDLAMRFAFERLVLLLEDRGQSSVTVVAEARTPNQDDALRRHLQRLLKRGTDSGWRSTRRPHLNEADQSKTA